MAFRREYVRGALQIVRVRDGSAYPVIANLVALANTRAFLSGRATGSDGEERNYRAIALLPDAKPSYATKRYGPIAGVCAIAGIFAAPQRLELVFGAKVSQSRSSVGRVPSRLGFLMEAVYRSGMLYNSNALAALPPDDLEGFLREFIDPASSVVLSKASLPRLDPDQSVRHVTPEIMIDACLFLLELPLETLAGRQVRLAGSVHGGAAVAGDPHSGSATGGGGGASGVPGNGTSNDGTTQPPPEGRDGSGDEARPDDGESPRGNGLEGDYENPDEDPVEEAIQTIWDVVHNPPEPDPDQDQHGDLESPGLPDERPEAHPPPQKTSKTTHESQPRPPEGERESDFISGSYLPFHSGVVDWGIRIDAARTFGRAASALKVLLEAGEALDRLPSKPGMVHPLHALAAGVLVALFHEWHHHLEELGFSELEQCGIPAAQWEADRWYRTTSIRKTNFNEELAEADAFDQLIWLLALEESTIEGRHWRDAQLRRYGLPVAPDSSLEEAVKRCEEEARSNGPPYHTFDQHRRIEPRWRFRRPTGATLPSGPPSAPEGRAGPAQPTSAYWRGIEKHMRAVATHGKWSQFPTGVLASIFENASEKYAPSYDSRVPVRFSHDGGLGGALLHAVAVLARERRPRAWRIP